MRSSHTHPEIAHRFTVVPSAASPAEAASVQTAAAEPAPAQPVTARSPGPDLVRAAAALLVVYLHACAAYLSHPMPGLAWVVEDRSSRLVSALFWAIELFIMPLFLLIAGYFAHRSWTCGGGAKLIASRARRLLLPLLAAAVIILPLDYYLWVVGWVIEGQIPADRLWRLRIRGAAGQHLWGLGHLWFLHYVFLYCAVLAAAGCDFRSTWLRVRHRWRGDHPAEPAAKRSSVGAALSGSRVPPWAMAALALPIFGCTVLCIAPEVVFGFQHAFLPVPTKWLYSGTFFFGGVAIASFDPHWRVVNRITPRLLGGGAVFGVAAVVLGQWAIQRSDPVSLAFSIGPLSRLCLAMVTVIAAWGISLGIVGAANRLAPALIGHRRLSAVVSYLAGAGLWIYLVHHPLVALIHIDLKLVFPDLSPLAKSLVATAISVGLSLAGYEGIQRLRQARRSASRLVRAAGIAEPELRSERQPASQQQPTAAQHQGSEPVQRVRRAA